MYTLDANIFLRDFDPYAPEHAICHELIEQLQARGVQIVAPGIILSEVGGGVRRALGDPIRARVFVDLLRGISGLTLVIIDEPLAQQAAEIAADYALRGMDAIYVATARAHSCVLVSLDREVRERAAPIVRALTPAEALAELP